MSALGILLVIFTVMTAVTITALVLLLLIKDKKKKKYVVYFLGIWGMAIAYMNATAQPSNFIGYILLALAFGAAGAVSVILQIISKKQSTDTAASILAAVSAAAGRISLFIF